MSRVFGLVAALVFTVAGTAAQAQPRERHHGGAGPWQFHHHHHYGSGPWHETYRTVIPTETIVPAETVVPTETVVTPSAAPSVTTVTTVRRNAVPYTGPGVTILLSQETGGEVTYLVDGREEVTIRSGQEQTLPKKGSYEVRFSRGRTDDGRDYGIARYTITEGTYAFEVTDRGWDLYRQPDVDAVRGVSTTTTPTVRTNTIPVRPAAPRSASAAPAAGGS